MQGVKAIKDEISPWRSAHDLFLATLSIQQTCFGEKNSWVVVSNIFYFHPYLGKIPMLTNIFQRGC